MKLLETLRGVNVAIISHTDELHTQSFNERSIFTSQR